MSWMVLIVPQYPFWLLGLHSPLSTLIHPCLSALSLPSLCFCVLAASSNISFSCPCVHVSLRRKNPIFLCFFGEMWERGKSTRQVVVFLFLLLSLISNTQPSIVDTSVEMKVPASFFTLIVMETELNKNCFPTNVQEAKNQQVGFKVKKKNQQTAREREQGTKGLSLVCSWCMAGWGRQRRQQALLSTATTKQREGWKEGACNEQER